IGAPGEGQVLSSIVWRASTMRMFWIFAAIKLGFELRIAAPAKAQPSIKLERLQSVAGGSRISGGGPPKPEGNRWVTWIFKDAARIVCSDDLEMAASGADLLYTDVWVSMGKEAETARSEERHVGKECRYRDRWG